MSQANAVNVKPSTQDSPLSASSDGSCWLVPLRTKGEVEANIGTVDVYIVEIPTRSTNAILELLRDIVPPKTLQSLQHLRRIVKPERLPPHLRPSASSTAFLIAGPDREISIDALNRVFDNHSNLFTPLKPLIRTVSVPSSAPASAAQASLWTEKFWPIVYRNTNPYGPHPSILRRAELELIADNGVKKWMRLARQCGTDSAGAGLGIEIGAVVVNRNGKGKAAHVVAAAGDARCCGMTTDAAGAEQSVSGNVMGHAVMRVISIVARKRILVSDNNLAGWEASKDGITSPFLDEPLTQTEREEFVAQTLEPNGYLCLDLELYVTHEPCVMCSMAILHSRFGRVVFGQRMAKTGALSAEAAAATESEHGSLGYGLFWRPIELNWRWLCWEFIEDIKDMKSSIDDKIHA